MRLHRLEVTAFGPFAETATVDFDALSAAGLFLLSGATGSGKTSVLDAVCFALYGAVPGERNDAKRLRSDQADAETAPRVVLDATLAGRRFRIERSPAWARPKRRGSGTTPQQASVVISERLDDGWVPLSTRLDETGHLVTALVGMNLTQFTQVAMLPQGRFQAFLRSSSEDRHRLLQQLFRTERFEQVESWLRDRRLALHRSSQEHERTVSGLVHRVSETAEASLPPTDASPLPWSADLTSSAHDLAGALSAALPALRAAEQTARGELDAARSAAEQRSRYASAAGERDELVARDAEMSARRARVQEAGRARAVLPLHRIACTARAEHDAAQLRATGDRSAAAALLGLLPELLADDAVPGLLAAAVDAAAAARALLPRERERATSTARLTAARAERDAVAARRDGLAQVVARLERARAAQARLASEQAARDDARRRLDACRHLQAVRNDLVSAQLDLNAVVSSRLRLVEELVTLQQTRLDGMAAEIAGRLAVGGGSCPVCGSEHHPHLATAAVDAPDAAAEKALRKRLDDAEFEEHARAAKARDLETQAALALQTAGSDDLESLHLALAETTAALDATTAEAAALLDLERAAGEVEEHTLRVAELDATVAELAGRVAEVTAELDAALGGRHPDLSALAAHHEAEARLLASLREALGAVAAAERARDSTRLAAEATAVEAGFPDLRAALEAALPDERVAELQAAVDDHARRLAAATAVLDDPALRAAAAAEPPDLASLEATYDAAAHELTTTHAAERREAARAVRLAELDRRLTDAVAAWGPVRAELELVAALASFVEGKSADNRLQMRLSAYVLGYRLSQVVAAANERLASMSDRRYSLEHTGRRGAGERRGGLSLLVRDDWSGESRDPATLSGGETFVVSLALALGLADVIVHEVGGTTLDTLFVDEGFGSLDADTLDDVMDTLDSLRDGGRVVGVVSHVAEMRDRIPTQLVVSKARAGSTVRLRG
ncbi:MAG TPA: SMC family ATPase [Nocardioides sp.]|nr:SMC family ATPase [Nocardioides sp.]